MTIERWRPARRLIPWQPFRELEEMTRGFEVVFGKEFLPVWRRTPTEERAWAPAIEMFEKDDKFVVRAELPGIKREEIDISVSDDTLTIKGERKSKNEVEEEDYYCREHSYGSFFRSIALPSDINTEKIEASYESGVLEVSLPKAAEAKPKKISISATEKTSK